MHCILCPFVLRLLVYLYLVPGGALVGALVSLLSLLLARLINRQDVVFNE